MKVLLTGGAGFIGHHVAAHILEQTDWEITFLDRLDMSGNLQRIAETVRLSKRTHAILWQNITLALGIKLVFLFLAIFDSATMWMAVFADMGASLLVVLNGLRLLGKQSSK